MGESQNDFDQGRVLATFKLLFPGGTLGLQQGQILTPLLKASPQFVIGLLIMDTAHRLREHVLNLTDEEFAKLMIPMEEDRC